MSLPFARKMDIWTALTIFGLTMFGIVMIYSASVVVGYQLFDNEKHFFIRQIVWSILGLTGMVVVSNIDYHIWKKWAGWMLGITFILLISVFLFSKGEINGAHRWIAIGGQTFQPSELAKLTFILYASAWLVERQKNMDSLAETFVPYLAVLGAISFLMLRQPDFGTLSIILVGGISVYFVAGITKRQMLIGGVLLIVSFLVVAFGSPYRRNRMITFFNPEQDTSGKSYHVKNIAVAIGSGGWQGLGFGESRQKRLFLPEPQTDSIFAIITEELGFLFSLLLISVYIFLFYRGYYIAALAPDLFGRLIAVGITSWFAFQTFINLGSMLHLVPLVGVPLPFVSYGGTNLLISLMATGILLNISRYIEPEKKQAATKPGRRKGAYAA